MKSTWLKMARCAVASMEKIWIAKRDAGYDQVIFESGWEQLSDADTFYELNKILGK